MNLTEIRIIKRDGKQENFSAAKITNAIGKAFEATGIPQQREELDLITRQVVSHFSQPTIGVEEIQDLVENELMKVQPEVAKKYIIYRQWRNTERDRKTPDGRYSTSCRWHIRLNSLTSGTPTPR